MMKLQKKERNLMDPPLRFQGFSCHADVIDYYRQHNIKTWQKARHAKKTYKKLVANHKGLNAAAVNKKELDVYSEMYWEEPSNPYGSYM